MAYATITDFITAFTEREAVTLTNSDDAGAKFVNEVSLQRALDDASAEIDSYLSGRYTLPFASIPIALVPHCLNIARYRLAIVRTSEDVRRRYEDTIRWLELVAKGIVNLGTTVDSAPITEDTTSNTPQYITPPRYFSSDSLSGF